VTVTFPRTGTYRLKVVGKPSSGTTFQNFSVDFDYAVTGGQTAEQGSNPLRASLPYAMVAAGVVALYLLLGGLTIEEKK
jgi:hypothetical protein